MKLLLLAISPRYITLAAVVAAFLALLVLSPAHLELLPFLGVAGFLTVVGVYDLRQTRHSILRNYPIAAHLRFLLENVRAEVRQYFLENDIEGTPFSRDKRSVIYQRAKGQLDKRPFGTQLDVYASSFEWLNHSMAPKAHAKDPFRTTIGGPDCKQPYSASVLNV